jgi:flagellar hook-length control protein FliK
MAATAEQAPQVAELAAMDPSAQTSKRPGEFGLDEDHSIEKTAISALLSSKDTKTSEPKTDALDALRAGGGRFRVTRGPAEPAAMFGEAGRSGGVAVGSNGTPVVATSAWLALQARAGATGDAGTWAGTASLGSGVDDPALAEGLGQSAKALGAPTPAAPSAMAASDGAGPAPKVEHVNRPVDAQPIDLRAHLEQGHEALSKRLGEALAARLLAQIDKGEWQIRLTVAPQHLGPIDIDLQMRGQRIDAQFQVAHGQTQALIQDNLPRLREAVGASGMDLASVWVSGGWSDRGRGNPTPGQPENPAALALNDEAGDEQTAQASAPVESDRPGRGIRPGAVDILI